MLERWVVYSILSLMLWGFWGVVLKYASRGVTWRQLYFYSGLATATAVSSIAALSWREIASTPLSKAAIALAAGAFGTLGYIFMIKALEAGGKASIVVPLTSLYPAVTVALALLLLGEKPSLPKAVGVALAVTAIYLLSKP